MVLIYNTMVIIYIIKEVTTGVNSIFEISKALQ